MSLMKGPGTDLFLRNCPESQAVGKKFWKQFLNPSEVRRRRDEGGHPPPPFGLQKGLSATK